MISLKIKLRIFGLFSIFFSIVLLLALIVFPIVILRNLLYNVQKKYLFTEYNIGLWSQYNNNDNITNTRTFKLYSIAPQRFAQLGNLSLKTGDPIGFYKDVDYQNVKFASDGTSTAKKNTYFKPVLQELNEQTASTEFLQVRSGMYRLLTDLEGRSLSAIFVNMLSGLTHDMSVETSKSPPLIKLNYLNGKIFYRKINYRQSEVYMEFDKCQIKDWDTKNNLWFDTTYGFRSSDTFNVWVRIAYLHKTNIR